MTDSLQSEIQVARADNSILRQDIQVFRQRESQLYQRNIELEEQLIESNKEITKIAKTLHGKGPEGGADSDDKKDDEDQKEVNINVDFHTGDEPKAVFTEVKETDEAEGRKSVQSVKEKTSMVTYLIVSFVG